LSTPPKLASISIDASDFLKISIPEECRQGIEANLDLLKSHARILDAYMARLGKDALASKVQE
jgi:hypothetical protein